MHCPVLPTNHTKTCIYTTKQWYCHTALMIRIDNCHKVRKTALTKHTRKNLALPPFGLMACNYLLIVAVFVIAGGCLCFCCRCFCCRCCCLSHRCCSFVVAFTVLAIAVTFFSLLSLSQSFNRCCCFCHCCCCLLSLSFVALFQCCISMLPFITITVICCCYCLFVAVAIFCHCSHVCHHSQLSLLLLML